MIINFKKKAVEKNCQNDSFPVVIFRMFCELFNICTYLLNYKSYYQTKMVIFKHEFTFKNKKYTKMKKRILLAWLIHYLSFNYRNIHIYKYIFM